LPNPGSVGRGVVFSDVSETPEGEAAFHVSSLLDAVGLLRTR
jgi:hypothetical protein